METTETLRCDENTVCGRLSRWTSETSELKPQMLSKVRPVYGGSDPTLNLAGPTVHGLSALSFSMRWEVGVALQVWVAGSRVAPVQGATVLLRKDQQFRPHLLSITGLTD